MRTLLLLAVLAAGACSDDNTVLLVERQPSALSAATADGWTPGSAVVVAAPGSLTFPQPIAIRISIVDRTQDEPMPQPIGTGMLGSYGVSPVITVPFSCQPTFCDAELQLSEQGSIIVQLSATGPDGTETDCFYYGVYEDADPASATATHREELETEQRRCLSNALE
jgi:hypothetical protein